MAEPKKSMEDVVNPDTVAQPQTSRPLVAGNSNEVVDSTVVTEKSKKIIQPLTDKEKQDQSKPNDDAEKIEVKLGISEVPSVEAKVEPAPTEKPPEPEVQVEGSAEVDTLAGEVGAKRKDEIAERERLEKQAELEKKIESKEYFLPINDSKTSSKIGVIFLVLLLLGVAVAGSGYYYMTQAK
ncbi:MAG: hypothetical protein AAB914_03390 [Patescibacteria group bacterium]